jgi:hydrophobic/amphiphilic exporter-1 (mainly G- bacteria), HAE1 family
MLENIVRHMEKGEKPLQAALNGSREIGFTILSMTLSLVAVFIPVLFMGGIVGRLLHEFAVTISVAVLISGVVSLSLTPMLCAIFLRPKEKEQHGRFYRTSDRFFQGMLGLYERSLQWAIRFRRTTLTLSLVFLVLVIYLFMAIPKGFLPSDDTDQLICFTEARQGVAFDAMIDLQMEVASIIAKNPNIDKVAVNVGASGSSTTMNTGRMFVRLKPRAQRKASAEEIIQQLRPKLSGLPGVKAYLQNPPPIRIGGVLTKSQYQYTLQSTDTAELYKYSPLLEEKVKAIPGILDVTSDLQARNP